MLFQFPTHTELEYIQNRIVMQVYHQSNMYWIKVNMITYLLACTNTINSVAYTDK